MTAFTRTLRLTGSWRTLLGNFATMLFGEALARVFALIALLVLTRELTPAGFGLVSFGATLVIWGSLVVDSGTEIQGLRDVARSPARFRAISEPILGLRLALSVVAALLLAVGAAIIARNPSDRTVLWLFALVLPLTALNLRWMALGVQASRAIAAGNALGQLLFAAGVVILVTSRHGALYVPLLQGADELVSGALIVIAVAPRFGLLRPRIDLAVWRERLIRGWPLFVNNLARTVVYSFDLVLIGLVLGRAPLGFYSAAYRPVLLLVTVLALLSVAFLGLYSAAGATERKQLFRRTVLLAATTSFPLAMLTAVVASPTVDIAYGSGYHAAAAPLAVLIWVIPVLALGMPYVNVLLAAHRERTLMRNNVVGALANLLANLAVVPLFGLVGAAIVTVCSELLIFALNGRAVVSAGLAQPTAAVMRTFLVQRIGPRLGRAP